MIRTILVLLVVLIFFLFFSIPLYLILWIVGKFDMHKRSVWAQAIVVFVLKIILFVSGTKLIVRGREKIPRDRAVVYVGNHTSYYDVIIGYTLAADITGFIAKKEFKKIPFLNWWMYFVNCLFLDRDDTKDGLRVILEGIKMLKNGISIFVFPEGTRSKTGRMLPYKEGTMKLAEKSGAPVVPVAFAHSAEVYEQHVPYIKRATVLVELCDPIFMENLTKEEKRGLGVMAHDIVQAKADELMAEEI
ncbi:MAG: 1-acyl-sn-glycerol-3-phosphate acyltransferase [Lachnospiraceae bacterium]|nr:1-acyl-sn-glycerol-3-phosphate acyltransferase [Lachnospiraceae bacterium]